MPLDASLSKASPGLFELLLQHIVQSCGHYRHSSRTSHRVSEQHVEQLIESVVGHHKHKESLNEQQSVK